MHELLFRLNETHGTTFLVVTHSHDLAEQMPRVVHMLDGRIESDRKNGTERAGVTREFTVSSWRDGHLLDADARPLLRLDPRERQSYRAQAFKVPAESDSFGRPGPRRKGEARAPCAARRKRVTWAHSHRTGHRAASR